MKDLTAPVLLLAFNRPDTTQIVFDEIKKAKPRKLYVSVDGPRPEKPGDKEATAQTRAIIDQVDWECDLKTRFHDENKGCGLAVSSAISWVFEQEDRVIVLEDDCVPAQPFFAYCQELLEKYEHDTRVWIISGNNFNEERKVGNYSYFFSQYGHNSGWATWKRCWDHFDYSMSKWPAFQEFGHFNNIYPSKREIKHYFNMFNNAFGNKKFLKQTWAVPFSLAIKYNRGLAIIPRNNLVKNIGHMGTHSSNKLWFHDRPVDHNYSITVHPAFVLPSRYFDYYHFRQHIHRKKPLLIRAFRKLARMAGIRFS